MSRWTRAVRAHTSRILLVGIVVSLALAVLLQRHAIEEFDWELSWLPFLGAVLLFSLGPLAGGTAFWVILRRLAPSAHFGDSLWVWERSFAARYIPSGALTVAVRLHERERLGASRGQMLSATAYEQLVAAASAALVSLVAFSTSGHRPPIVALLVLVVVLAVATAAPPIARRVATLRGAARVLVGSRALMPALALCACSWLAAGAAAWIFVGGVIAGPTPGFLFLLGAYTFAWLVGFVVPIAPSGLGAREATLVALLAPTLGAAAATALAVGLRLASVAGDFLAIGTVEIARLAKRRLPRVRTWISIAWGIW